MAKKGGNKKRCEKYKLSGHREENKALRQKQNAKRIAKFAQRKADGKSYTYKSNPYKEGTTEYIAEQFNRATKNKSHKTEFQKWKSIMDKLNRELDAKKKIEKAETGKHRSNKE